jgi:hypothetical protein
MFLAMTAYLALATYLQCHEHASVCLLLKKFLFFFFKFSTLSRTSLVLLIGIDSIRVVMKDGRACQLSFEDKELQDLLHWQVCTLTSLMRPIMMFFPENSTKCISSCGYILHF